MTISPPLRCQQMCQECIVVAFTSIAPQFARDSALMTTNFLGDLSLVKAGFEPGVNLVSLQQGKLRVAHYCASLTWSLEKHRKLPQLAFLSQFQSCTSKLNPPFIIFHFLYDRLLACRPLYFGNPYIKTPATG